MHTQTAPILSLRSVSKEFSGNGKRVFVLRDITIDIAPGEFLVFLGPSGCGKSTLLRIMSGLEKRYEGSVSLGAGVRHADMSFVFQQFALFPWLTVYQNIELGTIAHALSDTERQGRILKELRRLGLEKFCDTYPQELSGGMRQRVGIARALASEAKIIFMDEPFSELDSFTATGLRREFLEIWKETGKTVIMVTHLIEEAIELADRIVVLTPRPGMIEKVISNRLARPRKKRTKAFWNLEDRLYRSIRP